MTDEEKTFTKWLDNNWQEDNMLPPPIDAQIAVDFLKKYFLGEDWYIVYPATIGQANTEIVHAILYKYSRKYRKEYKKRRKSNDRRRSTKSIR